MIKSSRDVTNRKAKIREIDALDFYTILRMRNKNYVPQ